MFINKYAIDIINRLFRQQNPSSIKERTDIQPLGKMMPLTELEKRKRLLEEEKSKLLEIVERNSHVEFIPKSK